jgi:hypothetical protein
MMPEKPTVLHKAGSGSDSATTAIPFALAAATTANRFWDEDVGDTAASVVYPKPTTTTRQRQNPPNFA